MFNGDDLYDNIRECYHTTEETADYNIKLTAEIDWSKESIAASFIYMVIS